MSLAGQSLVTACLDGGAQYQIHAALLRSFPSLFDEKLSTLEQDDASRELKPLLVPDVSAETFDTFLHWINAKITDANDVVIVDELENDDSDDPGSDVDTGIEADEEAGIVVHGKTTTGLADDNDGPPDAANASDDEESPSHSESSSGVVPWYSILNRQQRVFGRLIDCYIFATRYETIDLRRDVILKLQRCIASWQMLPCQMVVGQALDNLVIGVPLCRYLISCYGYYTDYKFGLGSGFATLTSDFLSEVLIITFARLGNETVTTIDKDWCEFHEHKDYAEREKCEEMRESDPDVEAKRARAAWLRRR